MTFERVDPARIEAGGRELDRRVEAAERTGDHVWVVTAAFGISHDLARRLAAGDPDAIPIIDNESLLHMAPGCYRCEEPLTRTLFERRCRGTLGVHP